MRRLFNLQQGAEDRGRVLENVRAGISFYGSNFWILACAIMIASVGLNVNSTAVVIGAMLISPLMGPIVGAGFALGMYDFPLLRKSLKNLLISTAVGLTVSFLYFLLTPIREAQSEILARTSPNIFDVLIAFFGGLVGVIAITRVEKGNPILGVAIATALMPPLCTAGYGLAMGNYGYFGGAMFLYVINCVFIGIATFIIVKYLNYPAAKFVDKKEERRVRNWITAITILIVIPSLFFAWQVIQKQRFYSRVDSFIQKEFEDKGNTIIYKRTDYATNPKRIELAFLTRKFNAKDISDENVRLKNFGLENTRLIVRQDSAFLANAAAQPSNEAIADVKKMAAELKSRINESDAAQENIFPEAKALFPNLEYLSAGRQRIFSANDSLKYLPTVVYGSSKPLNSTETKIFGSWLKARLRADTIQIIRR